MFLLSLLLASACSAYFVAYSPSTAGMAAISILSDGSDGHAFGSVMSTTVIQTAPGDPTPCYVAQYQVAYLFAVDAGIQRLFLFNSSVPAPWPVTATYASDDTNFIVTDCSADDYEFVDFTLRNTSSSLTRFDELPQEGLTVWRNYTGQPSPARSWDSNDTAFVPTLSSVQDRDDFVAMFGVAVKGGFLNSSYVVGVGCDVIDCDAVAFAPFPAGHQSPIATSFAGIWPTGPLYEIWPLLVLQRPEISTSTFFVIDQFNANLNQTSGVITSLEFNTTLTVGPVDMTQFPRISSYALYGNDTIVCTSMPTLSTVFVRFNILGQAFAKLVKGFAVVGQAQ